jgi:hypothetical protein
LTKQVSQLRNPWASAGSWTATTYNDIDEALSQLVKVANYISANLFYDAAFGSVVATPQFDVLEGLDQPWATLRTFRRCTAIGVRFQRPWMPGQANPTR